MVQLDDLEQCTVNMQMIPSFHFFLYSLECNPRVFSVIQEKPWEVGLN